MKFTQVEKSRAKLGLNHPFFASLLMSTPAQARDDIPTAATDGKKIFYNPAFMESLDADVALFVWAHEVMHMALMHVTRRGGRDHLVWNIAGDYAINLMLHNAGLKIWEECCFDTKYADMTAEQIYRLLEKEYPPNGEGVRGLPKDGLGSDIQESPSSEVEKSEAEQVVRGKVANAMTIAKLAGKLPGAIERLITGMLAPQVPWEEYLREFMTRTVQDDESWSKRNRRFTGVYLPSRHSLRMGEIVVIGDTSGSIGEKELNQVASEVSSIADMMQPERIRMIWADTEVAKEQVFECGDELKFDPGGGGGTDMRVPLAYVEKYEPIVTILITDGYTPWPTEEPPYPLIVCCTTNTDVPVGSVVRL